MRTPYYDTSADVGHLIVATTTNHGDVCRATGTDGDTIGPKGGHDRGALFGSEGTHRRPK